MKLIDKLASPRRSTRDLSLNIMVTLALAALFALVNANFIGKYNLISIGQNLAPYAILALGVLMPISMGGTDLSVGAVCIGSAVVAGRLYSLGMPLPFVIPVMLVFGCLIGALNGWLIAKKRVQPFIATLGTMMFTRGSTAIFANTANVLYPSGTWYNKLFSSFKGFPVSYIWIMLFAAVLYFIYRRTRLGRYMISIGSNERATRLSGIDADRYIILGYMGSGFMAGAAGIFWAASFATVTAATGNGMELDAIAAVYIGGTAATGGLANVFGCVIGSIMLIVIRSGLNYSLAKLNISINSTYITYVISGIIVVVAVLADRGKNKAGARHAADSVRKKAVRRIVCGAVSVALACFLVLYGISSDSAPADSDESSRTVCILMKSEESDYWQLVMAGADNAGEELGYKVIYRGPESEDASYLPQQIELARTLLSEQPAGFAVATIADGFTDVMYEAYDRGVPVVLYDSALQLADRAAVEASGTNPIHAQVVVSNYINASATAEKSFELVRDDIIASESYVVGIIQYENTYSAIDRASGFADRFAELAEADSETAGKVTVLIEAKPSYANNAYKEALEYLYEKDSDLIFCSSVNVTNQCADAVQAADGKYDGVKFVAFDEGERVYEWLLSDSPSPLIGVMSQNPYLIGYKAVNAMAAIAEGREYDETINVEWKWISPEDAMKELNGESADR